MDMSSHKMTRILLILTGLFNLMVNFILGGLNYHHGHEISMIQKTSGGN